MFYNPCQKDVGASGTMNSCRMQKIHGIFPKNPWVFQFLSMFKTIRRTISQACAGGFLAQSVSFGGEAHR